MQLANFLVDLDDPSRAVENDTRAARDTGRPGADRLHRPRGPAQLRLLPDAGDQPVRHGRPPPALHPLRVRGRALRPLQRRARRFRPVPAARPRPAPATATAASPGSARTSPASTQADQRPALSPERLPATAPTDPELCNPRWRPTASPAAERRSPAPKPRPRAAALRRGAQRAGRRSALRDPDPGLPGAPPLPDLPPIPGVDPADLGVDDLLGLGQRRPWPQDGVGGLPTPRRRRASGGRGANDDLLNFLFGN